MNRGSRLSALGARLRRDEQEDVPHAERFLIHASAERREPRADLIHPSTTNLHSPVRCFCQIVRYLATITSVTEPSGFCSFTFT